MSNSTESPLRAIFVIVAIIIGLLVIYNYAFYPIPELSWIFGLNVSPVLWLQENLPSILLLGVFSMFIFLMVMSYRKL